MISPEVATTGGLMATGLVFAAVAALHRSGGHTDRPGPAAPPADGTPVTTTARTTARALPPSRHAGRLVASPAVLDRWLAGQHLPVGPGNLRADMLPGGTWGSNLRAVLGPGDWRMISGACSALARGRCQVCGGAGHDERGRSRGLDCHELWAFDFTRSAQVLAGLIGLCPGCHEVQHAGRAMTIGRDVPMVRHLARVNGWSESRATAEVNRASREYERRCAQTWALDLTALDGIITVAGFPGLVIPADDRARLGNSYWK